MDGEGTNEAYRECLRNHAASLGSYATDGCGEFTLDSDAAPGSLKCAACGCHRNFHRKVIVVLGGSGGGRGGGGGGGSSSREGEAAVGAATTMDMIEYGSGEMIMERSSSGILNVKKRVRSKFTLEQKEKMLGFAEKLGWRIRRKEGEDDEIERFCRSVGVSRQVFKVWMHNHKSSSSSLSSPSSTATNTTVTTGTTSTATANASSLTDQ